MASMFDGITSLDEVEVTTAAAAVAKVYPLPHFTTAKNKGEDIGQQMSCVYHLCVWGYFHAVRFA
eukprot:6929097-Ditylum_brightwellii.AAC.1